MIVSDNGAMPGLQNQQRKYGGVFTKSLCISLNFKQQSAAGVENTENHLQFPDLSSVFHFTTAQLSCQWLHLVVVEGDTANKLTVKLVYGWI